MLKTRRLSSTPSDDAGMPRLWNSDVGRDTAFLLARANARSLSAASESLAAFGLKVRSYTVLAMSASEARPSQRELSDFLRLDPSQIVTLVDELESRGLLRREPDPKDRRAKVLVATPSGQALAAEARAATHAAEEAAFGMLSAAQRAQLREILHAIAD